MEKTKGEMPAHPLDGNHTGHPDATGLTKREYFSGLAMQGILSSRGLQDALNKDEIEWSEFAVNHADALIEQLNK